MKWETLSGETVGFYNAFTVVRQSVGPTGRIIQLEESGTV